MNILNKIFLPAAALLMLAGCSDDIIKGTDGNLALNPYDNAPGVYIGVNFQMPGMGSTRSTTTDPNDDDQSTSNGGEEVGQDYENNVNEVLLILARKSDYGFIAAAKVQNDYIYKHTSANSPNVGNVGSYHATAKFDKSYLEKYYTDDANYQQIEGTNEKKLNTDIAVFVVVNPNGGLQTYLNGLKPTAYGNTEWINQSWKVSASAGENAIWSTANGGNFLMTNSRIAIREIPDNFDTWELFSSRNSPFHLSENNDIQGLANPIDNSSVGNGGAVNVQRACARFDFRDGSDLGDNTYHALYLQTSEGTDDLTKPFIDVQLQRLSLVNMNNKFYYFERVSNDGLPTGATICGTEKRWYENIGDGALFDPSGGNYVVDSYAQEKFNAIQAIGLEAIEDEENQNPQGNLTNYVYSTHFEYPLFEDDGTINSVNLGSQSRWASSEISDILENNNNLDNYDGDDIAGQEKTQYHIWRYVTENIIPYSAVPYEYYQPNGLTTAVVFRAKMIANKELIKNDATKNEDIERNNIINAINSRELKIPGFDGQDDINKNNFTWKNPILYMYAKKLYATWHDMCTAAVEASLVFKTENGELTPDWNRNNSLYNAVFGDGITGCTIMYNTENGMYNVYGPGETLPEAMKYVVFNDFNVPAEIASLPNIVQDPDIEEGEKVNVEKLKQLAAIKYSDRGLNVNSANYAWQAWNYAGRPDNEDKTEFDGKVKKDITAAFKKAVTEADITIYQRSEENGEYAYYCYYYYWNRHNDNNRDGVMGPMEFCTVRNNVYKLSVSKISRLGHPRLDENDPNIPKGDDPDERSDVYITVDSKVIPWVVRINEIEF